MILSLMKNKSNHLSFMSLNKITHWDNPILNIMSKLEKNVVLMIESNS